MTRKLLALALSLAVCSTGCTPFRKINVYTVPQEMAIGEIFSTEVEGLYPMLSDPHIDWYINHRGRQLADLSDRHDLPYSFAVIDSPELNAFALPGGHIYINLGMIEACANESELVGLLAHEIGHVIAKHSMRQISQQSIIQIVGTIALNQYPNQWAALAANLFGATGFLKMSRDDERAADTIGMDLMLRAGYDRQGMATVFEMLLRKYDEQPGMLDKLFSTHPPTRERIEHVRRQVAADPQRSGLIVTTPVYQAMYDQMVKTYYSDSGRRRWRDQIMGKDDEARKEKDRLPWDTRSDEERKRRKEKERIEQEKTRKKREDEESRRGGATTAPAPTPASTPEPAVPEDPAAPPAGAGDAEELPAGAPTPLPGAAGSDASESGRTGSGSIAGSGGER